MLNLDISGTEIVGISTSERFSAYLSVVPRALSKLKINRIVSSLSCPKVQWPLYVSCVVTFNLFYLSYGICRSSVG